MGLEASCAATLADETSRGKALLETNEVIFRGDFRARVPLSEIKGVSVAGDTLTLKWSGGTLALELGAVARKWAEKIRNPPSRLAKLGVKPGSRVALVGDFGFDAAFESELAEGGANDGAATSRTPVDVLFYAPTTRAALARLAPLSKRLAPAGALWIVRPKGKDTPVTETDTRKAGLAAGLVDVKVAAFSATHTAAKFVIPVAKRPRAGSLAR
ncbi:MAG TPA: DUF3052 domain-containing protein [Polyangia bacterium]|jgi:hypothetical protein